MGSSRRLYRRVMWRHMGVPAFLHNLQASSQGFLLERCRSTPLLRACSRRPGLQCGHRIGRWSAPGQITV